MKAPYIAYPLFSNFAQRRGVPNYVNYYKTSLLAQISKFFKKTKLTLLKSINTKKKQHIFEQDWVKA